MNFPQTQEEATTQIKLQNERTALLEKLYFLLVDDEYCPDRANGLVEVLDMLDIEYDKEASREKILRNFSMTRWVKFASRNNFTKQLGVVLFGLKRNALRFR